MAQTCNKDSTMLNFWGFFFGRLPIGIAHFNTPEGGKRLPFFCWLLAGRNSLIFYP
jgi:hypothetical protein